MRGFHLRNRSADQAQNVPGSLENPVPPLEITGVVVCVDADRKILCGWEAQTAGAQQLIEKLRVVQDALPAAKIRIFVL